MIPHCPGRLETVNSFGNRILSCSEDWAFVEKQNLVTFDYLRADQITPELFLQFFGYGFVLVASCVLLGTALGAIKKAVNF